MKKLFIFCAMIATVSLSLVSCDQLRDNPVVEVADGGQIIFPFEGGEGSLAYTIMNPVEGGVLSVEIPEGNTWIEATLSDTCVVFSVASSKKAENRSETITLNYVYGESSTKAYINLIQQSAEFDYVIDAEVGNCTWFSNMDSNDPSLYNYSLVLRTNDGAIASLDLFAPEDTEDMLPPAGTYISHEYGDEEGYTLCVGYDSYSYVYKVNEDMSYEYDIVAAMGSEIEIVRDGDLFTVVAFVVAEETGMRFLIRYEGELTADNGFIQSTLTEDVNETIDAADMGLIARAMYYDNSDMGMDSNSWTIYIMNEDYVIGNPVIFLELCTGTDAVSPEFLGGTYTADEDYYDNRTPGTFLPGSLGYSGVWYTVVSDISDIGGVYYGTEAPIVNGYVTLEMNDDYSFNIVVDGDDDNYEDTHHIHVEINNVFFTGMGAASVEKVSAANIHHRPARTRN